MAFGRFFRALSNPARFALSLGTASLVLALTLALVAASAGTFVSAVDSEGRDPIVLPRLAERSLILAADGTVLSALYFEDRVEVGLDAIPKVMIDAVLAVEDAAFYEHDGLSVPGVVRAVKSNTEMGEVSQGGSTITQQVVKNELLTAERRLDRKVKEAVLAVQLEEEFGKDEILERYLNAVYFGEGAHGVYTAAQRYFGKDLSELTLAEAALIAGQIASPGSFNPFSDPEAALERRAHVLDRMVDERFVSAEEADAAKQAPLPETPHRRDAQPDDYFEEEVRRQLLNDPRLGETAEQRRDAVFRGGLIVHTTLDRTMQASAEQAVAARLPESPFTAAVATVSPIDGSVLALVGGPGFERAKFNLATQGARQPGSSFKPIALAAALEHGISTEDLVDASAPCTFPMPEGQPEWRVFNYDGGASGGVMTLREATVKSSNCAYAQLAMHLGPDKVADMAHRLGIDRAVTPVPSMVLGAVEASPLEMAAAYATFAADGVYHEPMFIRKVTDGDGNVLFENQPQARRVMSEGTARIVTHVLSEVITRGTGRAADIGRPAAGKTGTAQEWRDAWFVGFTPWLATAVWMGHPEGQIEMYNVGGRRVTGGSYPAQIWNNYMGYVSSGLPPDHFGPAPPQRVDHQWIGLPPKRILEAIAASQAAPPPPPPPPSEPRGEGQRNRGRDD